MPRYIVKLTNPKDGRDYYLEWSTITDSPVTYGMSREEFEQHYREEYGISAMRTEWPERMARVDEKGTSSLLYISVEDLVSHNRAGPDETPLSVEGILGRYCSGL